MISLFSLYFFAVQEGLSLPEDNICSLLFLYSFRSGKKLSHSPAKCLHISASFRKRCAPKMLNTNVVNIDANKTKLRSVMISVHQ
jgi:hypothetical protein